MGNNSIPSKLPYREDIEYYINYLQQNLNGARVTLPEGKEVYFFFDKREDCTHLLCGKGKSKINYSRARTLSWIKYILLTESERVVKKNLKTKNIVFISQKNNYIIVCAENKGKLFLFMVTQYLAKNVNYFDRFQDPTKYKDYDFS